MCRSALLTVALVVAASCGQPPRPVDPDEPPTTTSSESETPSWNGFPLFRGRPDWVQQQPATGMRLLQYGLPSEEHGDATIAVFGGIAGTVEENFDRWRDNFVESSEEITSWKSPSGAEVDQIVLIGEWAGGSMGTPEGPGGTPDWGFVGTRIQTFAGTFDVKVEGPRATVELYRESYEEFLREALP